MHESVDAWIGEQVEQFSLDGFSVLEVGSRDLNGSVRHWFPRSGESGLYLGVDVYPGDGVDLVTNGTLSDPGIDPTYDIIICSETLEHAPQFWHLCKEMVAHLALDGWLLLTTRANGFPDHAVPHEEHGAGGDYWRFMPGALTMLFRDLGLVDVREEPDPQVPGVFLRGRKL